MRTLTRLTLVIVLGVLAPLGGCVSMREEVALNPSATEAPLDPDLLVPDGFVLQRDKSYRHERSNYRRLKLTYRRDEYLAKENVREFFRQHYARQGWTVEFVYGNETPHVILTKGTEEARVAVREDWGDAYTEFVLEVEPRQTPDGSLVAAPTPAPSLALPAIPSQPTTETSGETNFPPAEVAPETTQSASSK